MTKDEAIEAAYKELSELSPEEFQKRLDEAKDSDIGHILNEMRPVSIFPEEVKVSDQSLALREREAYEATVKLADATSAQEAIDYLKKVIAQPRPETKTVFNEVEINKVSLQPGEVLFLKVKGPDFQSDEVCDSLQQSFRKIFPDNKIGVLYLEENSIDISVISAEHVNRMKSYSEFRDSMTPEQQAKADELFNSVKPEEKACNPTKYCDNCNCGKRLTVEPLLDDNGKSIELPKEE